MDFVTWGVFFVCFILCGISVFFISVYGTSEQSFEDGLIKTGDKKKERKASGKKDETGTEAGAGPTIRKKPGKFSKKTHDEKEPKVMEPLVEKKPKVTILFHNYTSTNAKFKRVKMLIFVKNFARFYIFLYAG